MENASKALLIAAGVLVGLILITMIIYGHGQISSYYEAKEQAKVSQQLVEFNKQYTPYNRDNVRGSDLLTLINKVIDYNSVKIDDSNQGLEIRVTVKIPSASDPTYGNKVQNFYYNYSKNKGVKLIKLGTTYTADQSNRVDSFLSVANSIETKYTQGIATKLANNLSTIMGENRRKSKKDLLVELKLMKSTDTTNPDNIVNNEEILKYYQYLQFKRAHFNCENLTFDKGRVKSFIFKFNGTFE